MAGVDVVVEAAVSGVTEGRRTGDHPVFGIAYVSLTVERVLAGSLSGESAVFEQMATVDGTPGVFNGMEPLKVGDRGIFFLRLERPGTPAPFDFPADQSVYVARGGRLVGSNPDEPLARMLSRLTLDELRERILQAAG